MNQLKAQTFWMLLVKSRRSMNLIRSVPRYG